MNIDSNKTFFAIGEGDKVSIDYEGCLRYSESVIGIRNGENFHFLDASMHITPIILYIGVFKSFSNRAVSYYPVQHQVEYSPQRKITQYQLLRYRKKFANFLWDNELRSSILRIIDQTIEHMGTKTRMIERTALLKDELHSIFLRPDNLFSSIQEENLSSEIVSESFHDTLCIMSEPMKPKEKDI
jgi:hypothetical protein